MGPVLAPCRNLVMSYPPASRLMADPAASLALMREHPFAHLFTAGDRLLATRLAFATDAADGRPHRLRGHLNRQNPQVPGLDGAPVLVVFSGPATYVSPHWRVQPTRAGTFDYEEVRVHGTARLVADRPFFLDLIDDLSALIEPAHAEAGDYPVWRTAMAPPGYIDRLFPQIAAFEIRIDGVELISKLHQQFPVEDRISVARHLARVNRDGSRAIARRILDQVGDHGAPG